MNGTINLGTFVNHFQVVRLFEYVSVCNVTMESNGAMWQGLSSIYLYIYILIFYPLFGESVSRRHGYACDVHHCSKTIME